MSQEIEAAGTSPEVHPRHDLSEVLREYREREVDIKSSPPVIYLESVAGCPFTCAMCKPESTRPRKAPINLLQRIESSFAGLEVLAIHGQGEPLLADLDYFVGQSIRHGFILHMDTNGFLLTGAAADLLLKTRLSIRFSIHAGTPQTYYRIMGVDLNRVKDNIRYLVTQSQDNPERYDFWFSFIVMKENIHEIESFLDLTHECGIRNVRFMHLWPNHDTLKGIRVRGMNFKYMEQSGKTVIQEFSKNMPRYRSLAAEMGIKVQWGDAANYDHSYTRTIGELANKASARLTNRWLFPLVPYQGFCAAPWLGQLAVDLKGNVRVCCSSSIPLGNVYQSSLNEIWHGKQMNRIRRAFHQGYFPHVCGFCRGFGISNYPTNSFSGIDR